jgi:hypothetical protein
MPRSRRRKPKPPVAKTAAARTSPKLPSPPPPKRWGWKLWGGLGAAISFIIGSLVLLPQVTIDPTSTPQPSNPFSGVFKVENDSVYPIKHARIVAYLWCAKLGMGTDTTPPSLCMKGNIPSSKSDWDDRTIAPHDSYEVNVGDVLFGTPQRLLYADISIKVTYQPWFLPSALEREQRFYTRRKDDGGIDWLHKPME